MSKLQTLQTYISIKANRAGPDQTATVWSGFMMFIIEASLNIKQTTLVLIGALRVNLI